MSFTRKSLLYCVSVFCALTSCDSCVDYNVPRDTAHIPEFHRSIADEPLKGFEDGNLALYVDYSNCIADGMHEPFFQALVSPLKVQTKEYWAIEGQNISRKDGDIYELLNNVANVDYAAIDLALNNMADRKSESVLLTDGELFVPTKTLNNPNNPYMYEALKKWLLKGNDIHIISQPYTEKYKGKEYQKKRFVIIMTNDNYKDNIYERIRNVAEIEKYNDVKVYHLSGCYKSNAVVNGASSVVNENLGASVMVSDENYEVQEWGLDWKTIQVVIMNAVDDNGRPMENGEKIISGLKIDKKALGCYEIKDIDISIYNINKEYFELYNEIEAKNAGAEEESATATIGKAVTINKERLTKIRDFITYDKNAYEADGTIDLYFDAKNFAPDKNTELNGTPLNYFMIEIKIAKVEPSIGDLSDGLTFASITQEGRNNVSVRESIKNCVFDSDLKAKVKGKIIYRIYVACNEYK